MPNRLAALAFCLVVAGFADAPYAQTVQPDVVMPDQIGELAETLMIDPVIDILRDEGLEYGSTLENQMFAGRGGARWATAVAHMYDNSRMRRTFDEAFAAQLADDPAHEAQRERHPAMRPDLSLVGLFQPAHHVDQRRLAGARRCEQTGDDARVRVADATGVEHDKLARTRRDGAAGERRRQRVVAGV